MSVCPLRTGVNSLFTPALTLTSVSTVFHHPSSIFCRTRTKRRSSFHFLFHYPNITPNISPILALYNPNRTPIIPIVSIFFSIILVLASSPLPGGCRSHLSQSWPSARVWAPGQPRQLFPPASGGSWHPACCPQARPHPRGYGNQNLASRKGGMELKMEATVLVRVQGVGSELRVRECKRSGLERREWKRN